MTCQTEVTDGIYIQPDEAIPMLGSIVDLTGKAALSKMLDFKIDLEVSDRSLRGESGHVILQALGVDMPHRSAHLEIEGGSWDVAATFMVKAVSYVDKQQVVEESHLHQNTEKDLRLVTTKSVGKKQDEEKQDDEKQAEEPVEVPASLYTIEKQVKLVAESGGDLPATDASWIPVGQLYHPELAGIRTRHALPIVGLLLQAAGTVLREDPSDTVHNYTHMALDLGSTGRAYPHYPSGSRNQYIHISTVNRESRKGHQIKFKFTEQKSTRSDKYGFMELYVRTEDRSGDDGIVVTRDVLRQEGDKLGWLSYVKIASGKPQLTGKKDADPSNLLGATFLMPYIQRAHELRT